MSVSVTRDLSVTVTADVNADKLRDRQTSLKRNIQRGEPGALGVSQVMLGVLVMSYSLPLHLTEFTVAINLGVPWWSGLSFLAAGVVAIVVEKHCSMKSLTLCLAVTVFSVLSAVMALIIYAADLRKNGTGLSSRLKSSLMLFTVVQAVVSSTLCVLLYRARSAFQSYTSLSHSDPASSTSVTPPGVN